jgi:hypothetical protein
MESVIGAALRFDGNEDQKLAWLDAIFAVTDKRYGSELTKTAHFL